MDAVNEPRRGALLDTPGAVHPQTVGEGGLEPPRPEGHWHLKPARLPFRHSPETTGGPYHCSSRTPQPPPTGRQPATGEWASGGAGLARPWRSLVLACHLRDAFSGFSRCHCVTVCR